MELCVLAMLSTDGNPGVRAQKSWYVQCTRRPDKPSYLKFIYVLTLQLVDKGAKNTVAQSHSRIQSSFFRKPRDMSLEISEPIAHAVDVVLLTFFLSWRERQREAIDVYNL